MQRYTQWKACCAAEHVHRRAYGRKADAARVIILQPGVLDHVYRCTCEAAVTVQHSLQLPLGMYNKFFMCLFKCCKASCPRSTCLRLNEHTSPVDIVICLWDTFALLLQLGMPHAHKMLTLFLQVATLPTLHHLELEGYLLTELDNLPESINTLLVGYCKVTYENDVKVPGYLSLKRLAAPRWGGRFSISQSVT